MKTASSHIAVRRSRRAFTVMELLAAMAVGLGLAGTIMLLLVQTATEQKHGYADTTVEQAANITTCLRSMSANMGITPSYTSVVTDTNGNTLGYQSISMFYPTNGAYITA